MQLQPAGILKVCWVPPSLQSASKGQITKGAIISSSPDLQARAVVYLGYLQQPTVVELTVGPLPNPSNYTILREVPWNTRPPNAAEYTT